MRFRASRSCEVVCDSRSDMQPRGRGVHPISRDISEKKRRRFAWTAENFTEVIRK